jgi:hypothetical protein
VCSRPPGERRRAAPAIQRTGQAGSTLAAGLRVTAKILTQAGRLLDFTRPVAVTLLPVLLLEAVPPGSYLAISCPAGDLMDAGALARLKGTWKGPVQQQFAFCDREQAARFFAGTDLVEPGLVPVDERRADPGQPGQPGRRPYGRGRPQAVGRPAARTGRVCGLRLHR